MKSVIFNTVAMLMISGSVAMPALASSHKDTGKGPLADTLYCIRDFQTGKLMCLLVPELELDEA